MFPGQRLLFEAPQMAKLEIYTGENPIAISDKIPYVSLRVSERTYFVQSTWRW